jgi:hypothetical protein
MWSHEALHVELFPFVIHSFIHSFIGFFLAPMQCISFFSFYLFAPMTNLRKSLGLVALLAASAYGRPLGSSFGVPGNDATYDYIVVGGGTAGLTIASRLAEQNAGSVAVIEAGTFYETTTGNISEVPASAIAWAGKSPDDWQPLADWGYVTTPQAVRTSVNAISHFRHSSKRDSLTPRF